MATTTQLPGWYRQGRKYALINWFLPTDVTDVDNQGRWKIPDDDTGTATKSLPSGNWPLSFRVWAWDNAYAGAESITDLDLTWADIVDQAFFVDWDGAGSAESSVIPTAWALNGSGIRSTTFLWNNTSGVSKTVKGLIVTAHMKTTSAPTHNETQILDGTYGAYRGIVVGFVVFASPVTVPNGEGRAYRVTFDVGGTLDNFVRVGNVTFNAFPSNPPNSYSSTNASPETGFLKLFFAGVPSHYSNTDRQYTYVALSNGAGTDDTAPVGYSTSQPPLFWPNVSVYIPRPTYSEAGGIPLFTFTQGIIVINGTFTMTAIGISYRSLGGIYGGFSLNMEWIGITLCYVLPTPVAVTPGMEYVINQMTFSLEQTSLT